MVTVLGSRGAERTGAQGAPTCPDSPVRPLSRLALRKLSGLSDQEGVAGPSSHPQRVDRISRPQTPVHAVLPFSLAGLEFEHVGPHAQRGCRDPRRPYNAKKPSQTLPPNSESSPVTAACLRRACCPLDSQASRCRYPTSPSKRSSRSLDSSQTTIQSPPLQTGPNRGLRRAGSLR